MAIQFVKHRTTCMRWLRTSLPVCLLFAGVPAYGGSVLFDFDTGSPPLQPTLGLPLNQTAGGVTATFSGRFSIQSDGTTFFNLASFSPFSGNYLYPNDVFGPSLAISFDHGLLALSFDFVTADFGLDTNTALKLTAWENQTLVGSATSRAVGDGGWGLGALTFTSGVPFNQVQIVILPGAGSDFLADNFNVTTYDAPGIPEPASLGLAGAGLAGLATLVVRLRRRG